MWCACDSEFFFFEDLAKKQKQIYPDAADYGYKYDDAEIPKIKAALAELRNTYVNTHMSWGDLEAGGWEVKMFIGAEKDAGFYNGVNLSIRCCRDKKRKVKFITVDISGGRQKTDGYKK
jgi:hypothetical protein